MTPMRKSTISAELLATLLLTPAAATAQSSGSGEGGSLFGVSAEPVSFGPYIRAEIGVTRSSFDDATFLPPGAADPRIFFDLGDDTGGFASVAVGYDWQNGWRGDVGLFVLGSRDASGPWVSTAPPTPGPHADIDRARVTSRAVMASVYYSPFQAQGRDRRVQPYVTAGLGVTRNKMDNWRRSNPASAQPIRTFAGASETDLAFHVGFGLAARISKPGQRPIFLDMSYRHFDFGSVSGGTQPIDFGASEPREGLNFDVEDDVLSIGIRIPLQRL
ncbi:outer membrane protein [Jannaschia ovalis]|uniref:Outer membrane beta-barrel protein n=1 Tax=Jannaschia ovalis TaxID=3038773 RepID=A0ABY8L9X1_9RHOB|nr:outer membrane beta-barrel protein [Jannaschia sp. GRR-S6-38]WGH78147.1 outer membrane beta-barrel protein [Jannaschia sp. GRR-S6-38]